MIDENQPIKSDASRKSKKSVVQTAYKYSELTGKIIGCAMEVHKRLGNGFREVIYQRALEIELRLEGIEFSREHEMPIFYREEQIGTRRVDFLVGAVVSVELKALTKLEDVHLAQAINYLEAYNLEIGLLINFGAKSLEYRRLINPKYNQLSQINHR
ncbi:MAG TPA: GxxExxY protein [Bacteroidales bacterium]|nr:GxxExxY protein [Bacteroidales bacterium]